MNNLLTSTTAILASAALFAAGLIVQSGTHIESNAPATLPMCIEKKIASGPTIPPGPWDGDDSGSGDTKIASGPTIPPGPWDGDDSGSGDTKIASGPTIPPGPWDDDDSESGSTKVASVPTIIPGLWDGIAVSVSKS